MSKNKTAKFFDTYAGRFDAIYGNENSVFNSAVNRLWRKSMKLRYLRTLEGCHPIEGKTILDIGCGPGHYSVALALRGAKKILGVDFADRMIQLAKEHAEKAGMADRCEFLTVDFQNYQFLDKFDYSILMGFMDYIPNPIRVIERVVSLTRSKAFFSFPEGGTLLAWQRKIRYRNRCKLFLYSYKQLADLFRVVRPYDVKIEKISRDFFVTVNVEGNTRSQRESLVTELISDGDSR
jgi:2-polyprenyl-3-methyl-5-hydroxy-6-metoxy-1,4-benzoquinol methylase